MKLYLPEYGAKVWVSQAIEEIFKNLILKNGSKIIAESV
jgi:hypothetical protein